MSTADSIGTVARFRVTVSSPRVGGTFSTGSTTHRDMVSAMAFTRRVAARVGDPIGYTVRDIVTGQVVREGIA